MATFTEGVCESDPHAPLEKVLDEANLKWVEARNAEALDRVGDVKGGATFKRILSALDSKEKIPGAYEIGAPGAGKLYNFWQDDEHVQGIWRHTTMASYRSGSPEWTTALDLDALPPPSTGTAKTWVWHGSTLLDDGSHDRALIALSPGGSDADTTREFCLRTETFVDAADGGFEMREPAKTQIDYRSRDECLVGTDFGGDGSCLTDSGYPRVVKSWKRGTPIEDAVTVFEGEAQDIAASQYCYRDRGHCHEFRVRSLTFYTSKHWYRSPKDPSSHTADEDETPFVELCVDSSHRFGGSPPNFQNFRARSNQRRFGSFLGESIALVEPSEYGERVRFKPFECAHIEVGLKLWNPRRSSSRSRRTRT